MRHIKDQTYKQTTLRVFVLAQPLDLKRPTQLYNHMSLKVHT